MNHEVNAKLSHNVQDQVRQTTNAPVNSIFVKRIQFLYFIRAYRYILETVDNQVTNSTSPDHTTIIKHHVRVWGRPQRPKGLPTLPNGV